MRISTIASLMAVLVIVSTPAFAATASTSKGQVSVAQVVEALQGAETDPTRLQVLTAYLAALGETVGLMVGNAASYGASIRCERPMALDARTVTEALRRSAGDQSRWGETAATPILVADLMERAGCK